MGAVLSNLSKGLGAAMAKCGRVPTKERPTERVESLEGRLMKKITVESQERLLEHKWR